MNLNTALKPKITLREVWATPKEGMSLDELIEEMKTLGNKVTEVDRENNRLKLDFKEI